MDGKPELQLEKPQYSLGDKLRANCSSPPSNPPANITWFINDKEVGLFHKIVVISAVL